MSGSPINSPSSRLYVGWIQTAWHFAMASACPEEICLSRWMSRLLEGSPRASTVPLCRLWIPGTHDSGTWDLHGGSKAAFDTVGLEKSNFLSKLLELIGKVPFASRMTNAIVANLSKTQSFDVAKQLDLGIRYFDLRVLARDGRFWLVHGLYQTPLDDVLRDTRIFLGTPEHRNEVVILEINHLYGFDSPSKHDDLATLISESLKELIAPRAPHFPARTLGDIASGPARVLVLCDSRGTKDSDFLYPQSSIVSPWLNKASPDALLGDAARVWRDSRAVDTLYVCQGLITPDESWIKSNIMKLKSLSLNEPATRATRQVTEWLRRPEQRDVAPAIVIADFVETDDCDFIKTVIRRNYE